MSYDQQPIQSSYAGGRSLDLGLQAFMRNVYNIMGLGLALTGLTAFGVASVPALYHALLETPLALLLMIAPFGILLFGFTPGRIANMPVERLTFMFSLFSILMGASMAAIFNHFTGASIGRVFFITAGTFAGMSLYGYTTHRDLTGVRSFMIMGLIGVLLTGIVNLFLQSAAVHYAISAVSVIVFTGLTAWDTQNLKNVYRDGAHDSNARMAVAGALSLYMNFINLFMAILNLMGDRK